MSYRYIKHKTQTVFSYVKLRQFPSNFIMQILEVFEKARKVINLKERDQTVPMEENLDILSIEFWAKGGKLRLRMDCGIKMGAYCHSGVVQNLATTSIKQ